VGSSPEKELHVLCYQHHQKMRFELHGESAEPLLYFCDEQDCPIRYERARGYFIDPADTKALEEEILPRVNCPADGRPMYLAEVQAEKRDFRLWRCPECGASHTNEEPSDGLGKKMGA
jgi:hypothetical protein